MSELAERIATNLTECEKDLLLGNCDGWGSWMFEAGEYMVSLGLGTACNGSIAFDTLLADEVINILRARAATESQP